MDLRSVLRAEYRRRRARNPRYSLRAFAMSLGECHSTVLRAMKGRGRVTLPTMRRLVRRLGLDDAAADRALLRDGEEVLLGLLARSDFRPDARWLSVRTGLSVDHVCIVLHALLRTQRLALPSAGTWRSDT